MRRHITACIASILYCISDTAAYLYLNCREGWPDFWLWVWFAPYLFLKYRPTAVSVWTMLGYVLVYVCNILLLFLCCFITLAQCMPSITADCRSHFVDSFRGVTRSRSTRVETENGQNRKGQIAADDCGQGSPHHVLRIEFGSFRTGTL